MGALGSDDVPKDVDNASFSWERGPKLQYTDAAQVGRVSRRVAWNQTLRQVGCLPMLLQGRVCGRGVVGVVSCVSGRGCA